MHCTFENWELSEFLSQYLHEIKSNHLLLMDISVWSNLTHVACRSSSLTWLSSWRVWNVELWNSSFLGFFQLFLFHQIVVSSQFLIVDFYSCFSKRKLSTIPYLLCKKDWLELVMNRRPELVVEKDRLELVMNRLEYVDS